MAPRVRVLHVVEATGGGVVSVIVDSIKQLRSTYPEDFTFSVLYSHREETPQAFGEDMSGVSFIKMDMGQAAFSWRDFRRVASLRKIFREYDVVHCHSSRAGFLCRTAGLLNRNGTKLFYSPHCYAFLRQDFSVVKRAAVYAVEMVLARISSARTLACGDSELMQARSLSRHAGLIRNGVDSVREPIRPVELPIGLAPFLVVGSGRDCLQKDPGQFCRIADALTASHFQFQWIGPCSHPTATGWLERSSAVNLMARASVFVICSRWEGLPVAGLEALSLGRPLLVRGCSNARDIVIHGENGFIYKTEAEAVRYLQQMASDPALCQLMGRRSLELYEQRFSSSNYLELAPLYSQGRSTVAYASVSGVTGNYEY